MEHEKLIKDTYEELSSLSMKRTKENAVIVLKITDQIILEICPTLSEGENYYFINRYEQLSKAMKYKDEAFKKVYYSVVTEICSKLKVLSSNFK